MTARSPNRGDSTGLPSRARQNGYAKTVRDCSRGTLPVLPAHADIRVAVLPENAGICSPFARRLGVVQDSLCWERRYRRLEGAWERVSAPGRWRGLCPLKMTQLIPAENWRWLRRRLRSKNGASARPASLHQISLQPALERPVFCNLGYSDC